ncbi:putative allergen Asp f 4 [Amylocarpus encephaloides]|uniref:Allergen Asp f 4 n=1 Tax=Amylocarpus encephaloides TaxID=45428 RepID=A0A9P8C1C3_9HELO|nr:putative allergen Asp f 4 [Amylocarpus encephaloides]
MRSVAAAFIVAALSIGDVVAGPTHAHLHQRVHAKRGVDYSNIDYSKLDVDWDAAYAAGQASKTAVAAVDATPVSTPDTKGAVFAAKASSTSSVASAAKPSESSSSGSSSGSSQSGLLNGVVGCSNSLKAFGAKSTESYEVGDGASNNVGSPYGSNCMMVDSASGYDFTTTFSNPQSESITVNVWNKQGADGRVQSGAFVAPKETTLTFVLAPGGSQTIAIQENSNIGWAEATDKLRPEGSFDTTWGEATFLTKGSGYDMSAITNSDGNKYNMSISSKEVTCISDMTQNYWLTATQPIGTSDGSCFVPQSTATLEVVMGGRV